MAPNRLLTSRAIIGEIYHRLTVGDTSYTNRLAMRMSSAQETETYAWLGQVPTMREFIGGRQPKKLREQTFTVSNKDHEATLEVLVKEMRRDSSGQLMVRIAELSRRVLSYPGKLLSTLILNGASDTCYDSQYFFDTDHAEGASGTQSNKLSVDISALPTAAHGSVTAPSVAEFQMSMLQAVQALMGFKDDQGEPMNEGASEFEIMVPISLYATALSAVALPMIDNGNSNVISATPFTFRVTPNPRLTWTDTFAVFRVDGDTKPFILQEEVPVEVSSVAEGSELEFTHKKHWYGVDWSGNVAYGFWQHACQVIMV